MFKYNYMRRLFWEMLIIAVLCIGGAIGWYIAAGFGMVVLSFSFVAVLSIAICVFIGMYSKLYVRLESIMDAAEQHFVMLRPRKHDYNVYGSQSFLKKLEDILPQRTEISTDEYDYFYTRLSASAETLGGDTYYRYKTKDDELWLRFKRVQDKGRVSLLVIDVTDMYLQRVYMMQNDYYDTQSRLYNRDATLTKVQQFIDDGCKMGYFAMLSVNGTEKELASGSNEIEEALAELSFYLKRISTKRVIIGKASRSSFLMFFAGSNIDINYELSKILASARKIISDFAPSAKRLSVACGCCRYPEDSADSQSLCSKAEFAMREAAASNATNAVMFSREKFNNEKLIQTKAKAVHEVLSNGNIDYKFQPIVNARTGKIFAFEALMRPVSDIKLSPTDVIDIATKDNCLLDVERLTFNEVLRRIEENEQLLGDRKVFINSIPNTLIPEEEFSQISEKFGRLFEHTVIEITEDLNFDDESFKSFRNRFLSLNCQLALDDFGTGYSNESNLLKFQPSFLKMDKALIENMDTDPQKRNLVEGIVSFAKKHNIRIIAEGVETRKELESAISINVDYIQGFYTARPSFELVDKISEEISDHIVALNLKLKSIDSKRAYETQEPGELDIVELALKGYSNVLVKHTPIKFIGETTRTAEISVIVEDDMSAQITFENCSLARHSGQRFFMMLGENSNVELQLIGENKFSGGFNVPVGSELSVSGNGRTEIMLTTDNPIAFGSHSKSGYGRIDFAYEGECSIKQYGDICIGFGGVYSAMLSDIMIRNANLFIEQRGLNNIGIGSAGGDASIGVYNSVIRIECNGDSVTGIGVEAGTVDTEICASEISVDMGSDRAVGVGILESGGGSINITDKTVFKAYIRSKSALSVGARNGRPEIFCNDSIIDIDCEGAEAIGIGDIDGESIVQVKNGSVIRGKMASVSPKLISTSRGQIYIDSGNIITDGAPPNAINSRGKELVYYKLDRREDFVLEHYDNGDSGRYVAPVYDGAPQYIGVCLTEGSLPENIRTL